MLTSFFLNGKLIQQFDLAAPLGCNIKGEPVWIMGKEDAETPTAKFQGLIDELRISRCIRYDPDGTAKVDTQVFEVTPSLTMPIIETKEMP